MHRHTFLAEEGRWQISGSTIDVAGNANIAIGFVEIVRDGDRMRLEEQINELQSRYDITPLAKGAPATTFTGVSGLLGALHGSFVFFEDVILLTYRSDDRRYQGLEALRCIDEDTYQTRGAMFLNDAHVSSWSYVLSRK